VDTKAIVHAGLQPSSQTRIFLSAATRVPSPAMASAPPLAKAVELGRPRGQTSLNDALAVVMTQPAVVDRRQMAIVFTDGWDASSILSEAEVMAVAGRSSTTVFVVARTFDTWWRTALFRQVAEATGGIAEIVSPYSTVEKTATSMRMAVTDQLNLDDSFIKALEDFRSSYVVRYNLAGVPRAGWHDVVVKARRGGKSYTVRTRTGYIGG